MSTVLVTGAGGSIGTVATVGLADRGHTVVGLDLTPEPEGHDGPWHTADCTDPDAVAAVFDAHPLDAVVHLAGIADETDLATALTSHAFTTAVLLDAMVAHDVPRLVYAGSNHAVGRTPRVDLLDTATRPRPDTFYGVGKVAAEAVLSLYADRFGLDTISCRIGSFLPQPETARHLATWLSHDDCVRMLDAALTAPAPGYAVLYGISRNTRAWWDLEPGRALGFEPLDDAEAWADRIPERPEDAAENAVVGGPFAGERFHRPPYGRD